MRITFGTALDGVQRSINEPVLNEVTCGIAGLTAMLELRYAIANRGCRSACVEQIWIDSEIICFALACSGGA